MWIRVISDVHANDAAFETVLQHGDARTVLGTWFLGDLLGYGPDAPAVTKRFLEHFAAASGLTMWVPGNHDAAALEMQEGTWASEMNRIASGSLQHHAQWLREHGLWEAFAGHVQRALHAVTQSANDEDITAGLPRYIAEDGQTVWLLSHGGLYPPRARITMYLFPWSPVVLKSQLLHLEAWRQQRGFRRVVLLVGHTHLPMAVWTHGQHLGLHSMPYGQTMAMEEGTWILNPGSVGLPRDGDRRAAMLFVEPNQALFRLERVAYAWEDTLQNVWNAFPPDLAETLDRWLVHEGPEGDERAQRFHEVYQVDPVRGLQVPLS